MNIKNVIINRRKKQYKTLKCLYDKNKLLRNSKEYQNFLLLTVENHMILKGKFKYKYIYEIPINYLKRYRMYKTTEEYEKDYIEYYLKNS